VTIDHRRTALITGANRGIGLAIARQLGARGHSVWLGCRDAQRGESAARALPGAGIDARVVQLDVVDEASVAKAAALPTESCEQLDILVNKAGLMVAPPTSAAEESVDDVKRMFDTNVFGVMRVTQAFLPLLRKSDAGRIVMMSSGLASLSEALDMRGETLGGQLRWLLRLEDGAEHVHGQVRQGTRGRWHKGQCRTRA